MVLIQVRSYCTRSCKVREFQIVSTRCGHLHLKGAFPDDSVGSAAGEPGECNESHPLALFKLLILPRLYEAVFLEKPTLADDALDRALSVEDLWPIVVRALELADGWGDLKEKY